MSTAEAAYCHSAQQKRAAQIWLKACAVQSAEEAAALEDLALSQPDLFLEQALEDSQTRMREMFKD